jgi:hypothetical protein
MIVQWIAGDAMKNPGSGIENMVEATCRSCVHFVDDPACIEAEFPNLTIFGSAYSSARGDAGICQALDRFTDPLPVKDCTSVELCTESNGL